MLCFLKPQSRCNWPGRESRNQLIGQLLLVFRDGVREGFLTPGAFHRSEPDRRTAGETRCFSHFKSSSLFFVFSTLVPLSSFCLVHGQGILGVIIFWFHASDICAQ